MYTYPQVHTCPQVYTFTHRCIHTTVLKYTYHRHIHGRKCTHTTALTYIPQVHTHNCTYIHILTDTHMPTGIHTYPQVHTYNCTHIHIPTGINTYPQVYTYNRTYIHIPQVHTPAFTHTYRRYTHLPSFLFGGKFWTIVQRRPKPSIVASV